MSPAGGRTVPHGEAPSPLPHCTGVCRTGVDLVRDTECGLATDRRAKLHVLQDMWGLGTSVKGVLVTCPEHSSTVDRSGEPEQLALEGKGAD